MMVNPHRDGLNLTAKEFVSCQDLVKPGGLLLSRGAGAWAKPGDNQVETDPSWPDQMCKAIHLALKMMLSAKRHIARQMRKSLQANTLTDWWNSFCMPSKCLPRRDSQCQIVASGKYVP